MAEEHINTAFGAFGVMDVVVRRCMEGFAFWQRVNDSSNSILVLKSRLDLQRAKLAFWAQEWGIETNQHLRDGRFRMYEATVMNYLELIRRITGSLCDLDAGVSEAGMVRNLISQDSTARIMQLASPTSTATLADGTTGGVSSGPNFSLHGVKWALREDRAKDSLALLATLIQDLYDLLPPPRSDAAGPIVLSTSLASQDPKTLAQISLAVESTPLQAGLTWMKSIAYRMQAGAGVSRLDPEKIIPSNGKPETSQFMASYEGVSVFVETKKSIVSPTHQNQRETLKARIENIVMRLQDPRKPAELRTLPCQGISIRETFTDNAFHSNYNIVYRVDARQCFSLRTILSLKINSRRKSAEQIQQSRACLPLGRRFLVAQTLTRAVMYLHLADWLHKAIRSKNIVFFANDMASLGSALPYLVGFEYSRLDALGEQTEIVLDEDEYNYYRHPNAQAIPVADSRQPLGGPGRYSKVYDIYSVGVVLVELGLFIPARHIVERHATNPTREKIRSLLIEKAIPELRFSMGDIYANVARICLDGFLDNLEGEDLHQAFLTHVVRELELCSA
ncbi:hypothetical protein P885DRAFT_79996 [Corynascus similis CBS 632.67]